MTIQYINVALGAKLANGDYASAHKGNGTSALAGTAGVYYDDASITSLNQLKAAINHALERAVHAGLTRG